MNMYLKLFLIYIILISSSCSKNNQDEIMYKEYKYDDNGRIIPPSKEQLNHIDEDGGDMWNRLVFEKSPYLLQHAANPVDWYPWSEDAFILAKKLFFRL